MTRWDETEAHDLTPTTEERAEARDRANEKASIVLPARHERETAPSCWGCGAPRGARCAAWCRSEHGS